MEIFNRISTSPITQWNTTTSQSNADEIDLIKLQNIDKNLNGINITKLGLNSQFKVTTIDLPILQSRGITNISIGDMTTKVNDIDLQSFSTKDAAILLSSEILFSILSYSQAQWRSLNRMPISSNNSKIA